MKQQPLLNVLLACIFAACGHSPSTNNAETQNSNPTKADVMKFIKHEVVDNQGTHLVASTYLLPEGWTAQDQLYWEYNDATVPIRYKGIFKSADGSMGIQSYPDVRATWYTGPSGTGGYPAPSDIVTGLKDLVKAERKGLNYRITDQKIISNSGPQNGAQQSSQWVSHSQTGVVKIEYQQNGQDVEEEFYGQLDVTDMRTPSVMGEMKTIIWSASNLYSCRAPKGSLEDCRKIALTAKSSARLSLPFYNRLAQVIQLLSNHVYQQIYQAGQISKIISQTNDQMIANIDASYQQTQKANDHVYDQFSDYMRGVDRYNDGGSQIQLPSGYTNAWVNDRGEYLLSNTQGYDPNTALNGNWKELHKN